MLGNAGIYANKKRRKPVQKPKKLPGSDGVTKSNPSKRHRDRLNGELDHLTDLLPFPDEVRSRLDKLSVLRLSVGYLKVKSFFKATMKKNSVTFPGGNGLNMNGMDAAGLSEGDLLLQALNGFVMVVAADGLVFYGSSTIQDYLGFHQSDVVHQSVFDLIHTDDRASFRQQLHFAFNPKPFVQGQDADGPPISSDTLTCDPDQLPPENSSFLERSFVCRFRCLLDNSSGFLALKFQGRLKFLYGQSFMNEDGTHIQPQLALFTIATPVQPPSILEIRSKTLIFQTKHKLDFTPMGIDARGKVVLGYSETELCMRGSGYQFIHAADMMHCADTHLRMMKTGESGLTVFRLLTKARVWVWVQSNAKLIYKGGRPDFIIARQRALINAEGEEHLRQRSLQLPFSFTTGEAVLYESGPSLDAAQFQSNGSAPQISKDQTDVGPNCLLSFYLKQGEAVYTQSPENQLPEDQVFMDSRALVNVPSDSWQALGSSPDAGGSVSVKEEGGVDSVMSMIDALGKMAQDGDLCAALQNLDVDAAELMEWENALQKLDEDRIGSDTRAELDSILTNDVFNYMENVLFKQGGEGHPGAGQDSCVGAVNQGELFARVLQPSNAGRCGPQLSQRHGFDRAPVDGLRARTQGANCGPVGVAAQGVAEPGQVVLDSASKLSHYGPPIPPTDLNGPSLQQLQLRDIFSPAIELPELSFPATSGHSSSVTFGSCEQAPFTHTGYQSMPGPKQANQSLQQCPHNGLQAQMAANGKLHSSVQQYNNEAPSVVDTLPSLIPCNGFSSPIESSTNNVPNSFPTACLQGSALVQAQNNLRLRQWPESQQQRLFPASIMQNEHKLMPACHSQVSDSPRLPPAGLWPQNINGLNHAQQGWLAAGQHAPPSSCMFEKSSFPLPNGGDVDGTELTPPVSSYQKRSDAPLDQSPPQGSCYFQWGCSEPVVGTSAIMQENASISPQSRPLLHNVSSPEDILAMQRYLGCSEQKQIPALPAENNTLFSIAPLVDGNMYFPEQTPTNCCNF